MKAPDPLVFCLFAFFQSVAQADIYVGEPLGEAMADLLDSGAVMVASPIANANVTNRVDVLKLKDGRFLMVKSHASKVGDRFSLTRLFLFAETEAAKPGLDRGKERNSIEIKERRNPRSK